MGDRRRHAIQTAVSVYAPGVSVEPAIEYEPGRWSIRMGDHGNSVWLEGTVPELIAWISEVRKVLVPMVEQWAREKEGGSHGAR